MLGGDGNFTQVGATADNESSIRSLTGGLDTTAADKIFHRSFVLQGGDFVAARRQFSSNFDRIHCAAGFDTERDCLERSLYAFDKAQSFAATRSHITSHR